eukprot:TRINITY_DN10197_c0_g1_i1.p1 TRINITY_DN10197_c0_g1~~TRINITY_DN10197_c0_g1_i1.p1  ORF type:complete len:561 (+),score=110.00 TRINITY_DN10197_c0_g1_i1:46-1683(+)
MSPPEPTEPTEARGEGPQGTVPFLVKYGPLMVLVMTGLGLVAMQELKRFEQVSLEGKLDDGLGKVEANGEELRKMVEKGNPVKELMREMMRKWEDRNEMAEEKLRVLRQRVKLFKRLEALDGSRREDVVSEKNLILSHKFVGCYEDDVENRVLDKMISNTRNQNCMTVCKTLGYIYTGYEYGVECWCSNTLPPVLRPFKECNHYCTWNKLLSCGAASRLAIYAQPQCRTTAQLGNHPTITAHSSLRHLTYNPKNCSVKAFMPKDVSSCLSENDKVVVFGSSTASRMVSWLTQTYKIGKDLQFLKRFKQFGWNVGPDTPHIALQPTEDGYLNFFDIGSMLSNTNGVMENSIVESRIEDAGAIVIVPDLKDLSVNFCGVAAFYKKLKELLGTVGKWLRMSAPVHLAQIPQVLCPEDDTTCRQCLTSKKLYLAREAISFLAQCSSREVRLLPIDAIPPNLTMTYLGPQSTPWAPPVHNSSVTSIYNDLLLASLCAHKAPFDVPLSDIVKTCDERRLLKAFEDPEANAGCPGVSKCPFADKPPGLTNVQ